MHFLYLNISLHYRTSSYIKSPWPAAERGMQSYRQLAPLFRALSAYVYTMFPHPRLATAHIDKHRFAHPRIYTLDKDPELAEMRKCDTKTLSAMQYYNMIIDSTFPGSVHYDFDYSRYRLLLLLWDRRRYHMINAGNDYYILKEYCFIHRIGTNINAIKRMIKKHRLTAQGIINVGRSESGTIYFKMAAISLLRDRNALQGYYDMNHNYAIISNKKQKRHR